MSFTERDYLLLSFENRIRKLLFAIKQYLEGEKDYDYIKFLIELFNKYENIKLNFPKNQSDFKNLYDHLYSILLKENPFLPNLLFDNKTKERFILPIKIILENLRSPYNVGSIIRSAEAFCVDEIIITGFTPRPDNKKVQKTAMNSIIRWNYYENSNKIIKELKNKKYKIYSIEKTNNSKEINTLYIRYPCVFIFGNEEFGISREVLSLSDEIFHIEMYGTKNSLNVSVACGIILYEAIKRMKKK